MMNDSVIHMSVEKFLKYVENELTLDNQYKLVLFFMMNSVGVKNMTKERKIVATTLDLPT